MSEMREQHGLRVANVFHAGDGNLHPLILYDANKPGELEAAEAFGADILRLCVEVGGVLTGEHGVGVEKRDLMGTMFSEIDLDQQQRVKCAFDPDGLLNPGKVFPELHRCAELGRLHCACRTAAARLRRLPTLPRFLRAGGHEIVPSSQAAALGRWPRSPHGPRRCRLVADALGEDEPLELVGGGSKRGSAGRCRRPHTLGPVGLAGIAITSRPSWC